MGQVIVSYWQLAAIPLLLISGLLSCSCACTCFLLHQETLGRMFFSLNDILAICTGGFLRQGLSVPLVVVAACCAESL
jgi:ABC-type multidrug transport system permease subunit